MGIKYNLPVTNNAFAAMLETGDSFLLQATAACIIFAVPMATRFFREETALLPGNYPGPSAHRVSSSQAAHGLRR